jgi:hypothetical protein
MEAVEEGVRVERSTWAQERKAMDDKTEGFRNMMLEFAKVLKEHDQILGGEAQ